MQKQLSWLKEKIPDRNDIGVLKLKMIGLKINNLTHCTQFFKMEWKIRSMIQTLFWILITALSSQQENKMKLIHPNDALFQGEKPFPAIPCCEHFAGSEKLITKALNFTRRIWSYL